MRKIRFHLKGGLGNQLFILAAALYLAKKGGFKRIVLDTSFLRQDSKRSLELDHFDLPQGITISGGLLHSVLHKKRFSHLTKYFGKIFGIEDNSFLLPPFSRYLCFEGYFQKHKYADQVKAELLKVFESSDLESNSIVLPDKYFAAHLRRGDYLNPETLAVHGIVSAAYIRRGIIHLQNTLGSLPVIIFTDSPNVAEQELAELSSDFLIVGPDQVSAPAVVILMSRARGLVISNSSLSWWAAWLATRKSNAISPTIVRPKNWYSQEETPEGLLPSDWLAIES